MQFVIGLVKLAFNGCMSYANINGHLSSPIYILRGLHQGSPLSPVLFLLVSQVLTKNVSNNSSIVGLKINDIDILISLFADDTDLYLEPSESCVEAVIEELGRFGRHSGCKPNLDKTKCIPLGATKYDTEFIGYLNHKYGNSFVDNSFKALGINFDNYSSIEDISRSNYLTKLNNALAKVNTWSRRDLTILGKCTIIKTLILAQFTYLIQPLLSPENNIIKSIDTLIFHFLWGCKRDKIKRNIVSLPRECGGLDLFSARDFILGLKVILIKKLLDPAFAHYWKDIIINQLQHPNYPVICIENGLSANNKGFTCNLLSCYSIWKVRASQASNGTPNHCIWANKQITDIGSKMWNPALIDRGILYLSHFLSDEGRLLSFDQFKRKWRLLEDYISSTQYASIKLAIRRFNCTNDVNRNIAFVDTDVALTFLFDNNLESIPTRRSMRGRQVRNKMIDNLNPNTLHPLITWGRDLNHQIIDWSSVFSSLFFCFSNNFKLIQFYYKLLHRISTCRYMRFKMHIETDNPNCSLCGDGLETLSHIFIHCTKTTAFLTLVDNFIRGNLDSSYQDPHRLRLVTLSHNDQRVNFLNAVCAWYISKRFHNKQQLVWEGFIKHVKLFLYGEKRNISTGLKDILP